MSWALPLSLGPDGSFPRERPDPLLDTARLVLGTAPGERPLSPEFGWRGHGLPRLDDAVQRELAAVLAEDALGRWAPELLVERVEVSAVEGRLASLALRARNRWHRLEIELVTRDA